MSDFCYSLPVLNRIFHQVELMDRMMGLVGVDPAVAGRVDKGTAWYEARTNCISCCHERECRNWLECSEGLPVPPDFCPNLEFFGRCAETAPAAPRAAAWKSARVLPRRSPDVLSPGSELARYQDVTTPEARIANSPCLAWDTAMSTDDARNAFVTPLTILLFALAGLCFLGVGATIARLLS